MFLDADIVGYGFVHLGKEEFSGRCHELTLPIPMKNADYFELFLTEIAAVPIGFETQALNVEIIIDNNRL